MVHYAKLHLDHLDYITLYMLKQKMENLCVKNMQPSKFCKNYNKWNKVSKMVAPQNSMHPSQDWSPTQYLGWNHLWLWSL